MKVSFGAFWGRTAAAASEIALKTAGASVDKSGLAVVSITASAVAKSDFQESVFAGSLIRGMTLTAMSIGSRTEGGGGK